LTGGTVHLGTARGESLRITHRQVPALGQTWHVVAVADQGPGPIVLCDPSASKYINGIFFKKNSENLVFRLWHSIETEKYAFVNRI
jgi:hypothetical protein